MKTSTKLILLAGFCALLFVAFLLSGTAFAMTLANSALLLACGQLVDKVGFGGVTTIILLLYLFVQNRQHAKEKERLTNLCTRLQRQNERLQLPVLPVHVPERIEG